MGIGTSLLHLLFLGYTQIVSISYGFAAMVVALMGLLASEQMMGAKPVFLG